ncbi:MAG: DUF4433 domain-containing protein [Lyngbya sp. HA4199-MV5]|jgi:hypothetical protein|nr:DUF4433 domain-containing protein [Lyngbya sp. HA4199-MV5]
MPTPIYHITHLGNLASILAIDGLCAYSVMQQQGIHYTDLANQNIQTRRTKTIVSCGAGGKLTDYVPFYFAPRSPMLYAIHQGNVPTYTEGQEAVIYLVSTVEAVQQASLSFVFTDGHGIMTLTEFFDDLAQLDQVDWQVMSLKYWFDTPEDNDRKRRRQAEFLVYQFFGWQLVTEVGVIHPSVKGEVEQCLRTATHQPAVIVRRNWYY